MRRFRDDQFTPTTQLSWVELRRRCELELPTRRNPTQLNCRDNAIHWRIVTSRCCPRTARCLLALPGWTVKLSWVESRRSRTCELTMTRCFRETTNSDEVQCYATQRRSPCSLSHACEPIEYQDSHIYRRHSVPGATAAISPHGVGFLNISRNHFLAFRLLQT